MQENVSPTVATAAASPPAGGSEAAENAQPLKASGGDEGRIVSALRRILRAVAMYNRHLAADHELSASQLVCLHFLHHNGPASAGAVAAAAGLSPATVTGILDRLEERRLLARRRDPADRRRLQLELTAAGRRLAAEAPLPIQERLATRLGGLPRRRRRQLAAALEEVVELLQAEHLAAAPVLSTEPELGGKSTAAAAPTGREGSAAR